MTDFLFYAVAALALPVGAVVLAHIALRQLDRELARGGDKRGLSKGHSQG